MDMSKITPPGEDAGRPPDGFLMSLEPELHPSARQIRQAILAHALFAQRVCLTDAHLFASLQLQKFLKHSAKGLQEELDLLGKGMRFPLLGTCSRGGLDMERGLSNMLVPKGERQEPTYLSSLPPRVNAQLRKGFGQLKESQRLPRLLKVAGKDYRKHFACLTGYFGARPNALVVSSGKPQETFYPAVEQCLRRLPKRPAMSLGDEAREYAYQRIHDGLLGVIEQTGEEGPQTRERLHLAIYERQLPGYYKGKPKGKVDLPGVEERHAWRFLVDTLYNFNLSGGLALQAALASRWFDIPRHLLAPLLAGSESAPARAADMSQWELELGCPIYTDQLTVPLVVSIRGKKDFWDGLDALYQSSDTDFHAAFRNHIGFLSAEMREHLTLQR